MSEPKKEKKSRGTIAAEEVRAKTNHLSDSEREALTNRAMQLIYRGRQGEARVHCR